MNIYLLELLPEFIATMMVFYLFVKGIDFITGILKTWKFGGYKSKTMRDGIIRWIAELLALCFIIALDFVLTSEFYLTGLTLSLFIYKEAGSILENLGQLGVNLPSAIQDHLEVLNKDNKKGKDVA